MRIVVTGGAGFIGANLVRALIHDAAVTEVAVIDDLSTGFAANLDAVRGASTAVELSVGSITDAALVDEVVAGADAVVHLAARGSVPRSVAEPLASNHVNVDGTLTVLEAVRHRAPGAHVVFASSSSVYGANPELPKHEGMVPMPMSPYAVSKLAGEQYVLAWAHTYGIAVTPFRFFNVYGPLQAAGHAYAAVIPVFVDAALRGASLPVHGDGTQTRDFTYVGTVAEALRRTVVERRTSAAPVNLAFGTRRSLLDVITELEGILGVELERDHLPRRASDVRDSRADDARLRELLPGLEPVGFTAGLSATVEWMRGVRR